MKYLKVDYTFVSITLEIFFNYYILIKNTLDSINTSEDIFITTEIVLDLVAWFKFEKKKCSFLPIPIKVVALYYISER
jgi:hypothetical protein